MIQLQNQIYVMRHGQSENNVLGIESCHIETQQKFGLTATGQAQAHQSAQQFSEFDIIYSSPFRRAQETAAIVQEYAQCEIITEHGFREYNMCYFDQRPYHEADQYIHDPANNIFNTPVGKGDSFLTMYDRMKNALLEVDDTHENRSILVVSHGSPIEALLQLMKNECNGFGPFENIPKNAEIIHLNNLLFK